MVPRSDIVAVAETATLEETVQLIKSEGHSRMPVFRENLDDVVGMIHIKDVMDYWGDGRAFQLTDIMRGIVFVPESMLAVDLLAEMRQTRHHMAVVVDEYGGTHGLVTIEDLVEEIVGEIEDEHDDIQEQQLVPDADGVIETDARTRVDALERVLNMSLLEEEDEEGIDTLGGLVSAIAGRVPKSGEQIAHPSGLIFEIVDRQGASFLSQINFLVPIAGVIWGMLLLSERLPGNAWLALLIILSGVVIARIKFTPFNKSAQKGSIKEKS